MFFSYFNNLQILCPNCHSIQEGNSGANVGKYKVKQVLEDERQAEVDLNSAEKAIDEIVDYFKKEQTIYKELLADPDTEVKGTVKELADKYGITIMEMTDMI